MSDRPTIKLRGPPTGAGTSLESRVAVEKSGIDHAAADSFRDVTLYLLMGTSHSIVKPRFPARRQLVRASGLKGC